MTANPEQAKPFRPALTCKEARLLGYLKNEYHQAEQFVRMIVEHHRQLGTPRDRWEPQPIHGAHLADAFIKEGGQDLAENLEAEADPLLDKTQDCVADVQAYLDEIAEHRAPIITPESGTAHSVPDAVQLVTEHNEKIDRAEACGTHIHRRAPYWLRKMGPWVPWVELAGFLFFVAYFLNVPLLSPWVDFGGWTLSVAIVVSTILGQTWLVHHAASSHNHGREAFAEENRHEGEQAYRRRNQFLLSSISTVTAAITVGLVLRGTQALGDADFGTIVFLISIAMTAGVIMPALAYLSIALDGSKVSRERDSLVADLDEDHEAYSAVIEASRLALANAALYGDALTKKIFPQICRRAQDIVDGAYRPYSLVRLLIGGLSKEPLDKTSPTITRYDGWVISGFIGTSIPGSRHIDLKPLFHRVARLADLEIQYRSLLDRIDELPDHPWGTSRTN